MEKHSRGRQSAEVAEQTRHTILVAALRIFARQGFEAASMRDIALAAGTTHSLIRHHFGSKEGVWQAVVSEAFNEFATVMYASTQAKDGTASNEPIAVLQRIVRAFLSICARSPEIVQLLLHEGTEQSSRLDYVMRQSAPLGELIDSLIPRIQQQGNLQYFDKSSFVIYLLTAGAAPFGLPALSNQILQADILSEQQVQFHIDRILETLFPHKTM
jgi:AcrR family transcriptional regulator